MRNEKIRSVSGKTTARWVVALAVLALPLVGWAFDAPDWEVKEIDSPVTVGGKIYPTGCADGGDYRYFIQPGNNNLLIFLDGGGACWDANTCGLNPPVPPTFSPLLPKGWMTAGSSIRG